MTKKEDGKGALIGRRALALSPLLMVASAMPVPVAASVAKGAPTGQPLSASDKLGIYELFGRYAWSLDCGDEMGYLDNYTEDAVVIGVSAGQVFRGKEAIRGWYRYLLELGDKAGEDWQHDSYHHRISGSPASCIVYSYASQFKQGGEPGQAGLRSMGYFVSECVEQKGQWLLRRHSVNRWDRKAVPWTKPLPWAGQA